MKENGVHIAFDLETLDTDPGGVIRSIGAVSFHIETREIFDKFHVRLDEEEQRELGMTVSSSTEEWWAHPDQAEALRLLQSLPVVGFAKGLDLFHEWLHYQHVHAHQPPPIPMWSRGYMDEVMLGAAYRRLGRNNPWHYRAPRDARTLVMFAEEAFGGIDGVPETKGVQHVALDDAIYEAELVGAVFTMFRNRLLTEERK